MMDGDSWYPEIIPGKIHVGQTVTEEQATKIWEIKIKQFSDAVDNACVKYNITLNQNQRDALISCAYRLGASRAQSLVKAYKDGGNAGLWKYMKETYNRSYPKGTKIRLAEEYELFVEGDYNYENKGTTEKYDEYCKNPNVIHGVANKNTKTKVNNSNYVIVSNAKKFESHVKSKRFYQGANTSQWGDSCLGFSQVYTNAIYKNNFSMINNQPGLNRGNSPTLSGISFQEYNNRDKKEVLKRIYDQVKGNKPCIVQVNGNKSGTSRHYVTVIGYKTSATRDSISENDLLILDVWDGNIEGMNGRGSGTRFMISGIDTGRSYGYQIYTIR